MSTQICPNCQEDAFTWCLDEEVSPLTMWGCFKCRYIAYEDETLERECSVCGIKTESRLQDDVKTYWWFCRCNTVKEEI